MTAEQKAAKRAEREAAAPQSPAAPPLPPLRAIESRMARVDTAMAAVGIEPPTMDEVIAVSLHPIVDTALAEAVAAAQADPAPAVTAAVAGVPDVPFVVAADCRPQLGDVMAVLKKGAVLTDYRTICLLIAAGAPIMPQHAAHGLVCCPKCQTIFAPQPQPAPDGRRRPG